MLTVWSETTFFVERCFLASDSVLYQVVLLLETIPSSAFYKRNFMKNKTLQICDVKIHPGETTSLALPMPEIFNCTPMFMPIKVVHGKQSGPCMLVIAAVHGDELNGMEIINRLLSLSMMKNLRGTLLAIPVFNVYGFITRSRYLADGLELDRYFPGSETGSHAARLAHLFTKEIFSMADYCIDIRTGAINHSNLPKLYIDTTHEKIRGLAEAFKAPVICNVSAEKNSLRKTANFNKIPYMVYEAGEALRFDEHAIKVGVRGIANVLRELKMLPEAHKPHKKITTPFVTVQYLWVRASKSGVSYSKVKLGQLVKKGEQLTIIKDPVGATESSVVYAPCDGIIVDKNNLPVVHEGETLCQIAIFHEMEKAATHLEDWKERSTESFKQN